MGVINYYGLGIFVIMMISNIVYSIKHKEAFENFYNNKLVLNLEQIGRFGCFIFLIINVPKTWSSVWVDKELTTYIIVNGALLFLYCIIWTICFNKDNIFRAFALSILPSIMFIFSAIITMSILLTVSAIIFAPCHIYISYKNTYLKLKSMKN